MTYLSSANLKFWEFLMSGGVFMVFIILCCFVAIAVSIHRALSLRGSAVIPDFLKTELLRCDQYFIQEKSSALYHALRKSETPIGNIGEIALSNEFANRAEASPAVEAAAREEMVKLEGGMGILEVVITIAPLLGLLGTVSGLVEVFDVFGSTEQDAVNDPKLIAGGIATALNTTIAGLVVAVITVICHSVFTRRLEHISAQLEKLISNLLHQFYRYGGPRLYAKEAAAEKAQPQSSPGPESGASSGVLQSRITKQQSS